MRNRDTSFKLWIAMRDHFTAVNQALGDKQKEGVSKKASKHPDLSPASISKDNIAFTKAFDWISNHGIFDQEADVLMSFSTGLYSRDNAKIPAPNPDRAGEVGVAMQKALDSTSFVHSMETKNKVKNMTILRKPVNVTGSRTVVIDATKLFNRLVLITEREGSIKDALKFELTDLPMSLFDDKQHMRKSQKAILGKLLKTQTSAANRPSSMPLIVDGGWLLYQCNFESGETFDKICSKIVRLTANLGTGKQITVVFDGCNSSPKDDDHGRRSKSYSLNISLTKSTPCTMTRANRTYQAITGKDDNKRYKSSIGC